MKRLILLSLICTAALISSCQKTEYVTPNRTIFYNIPPSSWLPTNGNKEFSAAINVPEIDNYFNDYGAVFVYGSFANKQYEQFPEVYDGFSYSFAHRPGQIVVKIQDSDGVTNIVPPINGLAIKIVLVESR